MESDHQCEADVTMPPDKKPPFSGRSVPPARSEQATLETIDDPTDYVTETAEALLLLHGPSGEPVAARRIIPGVDPGDTDGTLHISFDKRLLAELAGAEITVTVSIRPCAEDGAA